MKIILLGDDGKHLLDGLSMGHSIYLENCAIVTAVDSEKLTAAGDRSWRRHEDLG